MFIVLLINGNIIIILMSTLKDISFIELFIPYSFTFVSLLTSVVPRNVILNGILGVIFVIAGISYITPIGT